MRLKVLGRVGLVLMLAGSSAVASAAETPLIGAIKQGDTARVRALLQQHADVNAKDLDGTTPLHWAVQRDQSELVGLLLKGGASATAMNRYGISPLLAACEIANMEVIDKLVRAGADANSATPAGETALMIAARTGKVAAVKRLVAAGADVNAKETVRGQTALMWAAAENNLEATTMLLEAGANASTRTPAGFTALHFAVRAGNIRVVKELVAHGASVNDAIQPTAAPRPAAAMRPTAATPQAPGGATAGGALPPPSGAEAPRPPAPYGERPAAANNGVTQLLQVFNTGSRGGRGGIGGTSPLVLAVTNAHFELASTLLDLGADPNANGQGWTALHQLAWTRRPPIQHGLPPAVPSGNMTSLELAEKLLQYGADPDVRMTREPADGARNILNRIGSTAFLQAAKLADLPFMKLLLDYGADPSIPTVEGATPLMAAAGVGIWQVGENAGTNDEAFEAVKVCYEAGNKVDTIDTNGDTALHGAAHRGSNEMVSFLVEKGAKLDVVNVIGWSPLTIAHGVLYPNTFNRHLDTAELLVKLGANPSVGKARPEDLAPNDEGSISTTGKR
jgi:uncharacterized protein